MCPRTIAPLFLLALAATAPCADAQLVRLQSPSRAHLTGHVVVTEAYYPQDAASGDLDGDGDSDLVVAHAGNAIAPKVGVLENLGGGRYAPPVDYAAPGGTAQVVLVDVEADGDLDAVFTQSSHGSAGSRILVYENDGTGSLAPYVSYTVGTGPIGLVAVDVDTDGDPDLVCANNFWAQEDVTVLYNDGLGGFGSRADFPVPGENPMKLAAGDLDGDGAPELVVSCEDADPAFVVLPNDGTGSFGAPQPFAIQSNCWDDVGVAVADVDLDGDRDVLCGTAGPSVTGGPGGFALFRNDGTGTLGALEVVDHGPDFSVLYDLAVDDVTGDGWPDVIGTERLGREGFVFVPGDGAGGFGAPVGLRTGEYARSAALDDVDGDGDLDAIVTNSASLTVTVHENAGDGFHPAPYFDVGDYIDRVAAADLDLDGDVDLLTGDQDRWVRIENLGAGDFAVHEQAYFAPKLFTQLFDVNGDQYPDAVFAGMGLAVALNDGTGQFLPATTYSTGTAIGDMDVLDAENDGDLDVVLTAHTFTESGFLLFTNDGTGAFSAPDFFGTPSLNASDQIETGDFTGDGIADVVVSHWQSVWLWPGNGGTFGTPIETDFAPGGAAQLTAADLDGDGLLDVAGSHWGTPTEGETLTVAFGLGNGTFTLPVTYPGMFSQWNGGIGGLDAGDVDGDGDLDLLGGCRGADDVAVFVNNGDRTFGPELRYGVDGSVTWLVAADVDGDGIDDVAANVENSSPSGGGVTVLLSTANQAFFDLGFALAGSAGTPALEGIGVPAPAAPVGLVLTDAAPAAFTYLVLSRFRVDAPLFGGTLVPTPQFLVPYVTLGNGSYAHFELWPSGMPIGSRFYAQAWTIDPGAATGVSASNALEIVQVL